MTMRTHLLSLAVALSSVPAFAASDNDLRAALEQRFKGRPYRRVHRCCGNREPICSTNASLRLIAATGAVGSRKLQSSRVNAAETKVELLYRGAMVMGGQFGQRSEEHTSELQSLRHRVCRLLLEQKKA